VATERRETLPPRAVDTQPAEPARPAAPDPEPVRDSVRAAPARTAADARREIEALIARYADALESESVAAIRRVYPGLTAAQERSWTTFFDAVDEVRVQLRIVELRQTGDSAVAVVAGEYRFDTDDSRGDNRQAVRFEAALQGAENGWRIASIR
jgi:hypothetical protein